MKKAQKQLDAHAPAPQVAGMLSHAKKRTQAVVDKLHAAMRAIERDIEQHEGIYPLNGGRLSLAEVCRRADVKTVTLMGPTHKDSTKVEVDRWLEQALSAMVRGKKSVRRAVTDRATAWKEQLEKIGNQYHLAELRMAGMAARIAELEAENAVLRKAAGRVVPLKGK